MKKRIKPAKKPPAGEEERTPRTVTFAPKKKLRISGIPASWSDAANDRRRRGGRFVEESRFDLRRRRRRRDRDGRLTRGRESSRRRNTHRSIVVSKVLNSDSSDARARVEFNSFDADADADAPSSLDPQAKRHREPVRLQPLHRGHRRDGRAEDVQPLLRELLDGPCTSRTSPSSRRCTSASTRTSATRGSSRSRSRRRSRGCTAPRRSTRRCPNPGAAPPAFSHVHDEMLRGVGVAKRARPPRDRPRRPRTSASAPSR